MRETGSATQQIRQIAAAVDPSIRLSEVLPLDGPVDRSNRAERIISRSASLITTFFAFIALLVSAAGTYSTMSFAGSRQTREIGVRIALGADRRRILAGAFSTAGLQIGLGAGLGLLVGSTFWGYVMEDGLVLILTTVAVVAVVGFAACCVPLTRALRIEPAEALRKG